MSFDNFPLDFEDEQSCLSAGQESSKIGTLVPLNLASIHNSDRTPLSWSKWKYIELILNVMRNKYIKKYKYSLPGGHELALYPLSTKKFLQHWDSRLMLDLHLEYTEEDGKEFWTILFRPTVESLIPRRLSQLVPQSTCRGRSSWLLEHPGKLRCHWLLEDWRPRTRGNVLPELRNGEQGL